MRGVQFLRTAIRLFNGACAGCGETPYVKLLSQLFGDRLHGGQRHGLLVDLFAATCRRHPWMTNDKDGRVARPGTNSLFEDNAEFGLGYRLAVDQQTAAARQLLEKLAPVVGEDLAKAILEANQVTESDFVAQRQRVAALVAKLDGRSDDDSANLRLLADFLVRRSVWIVGGDGWAYDIGFGGLDHVLAQTRDVNVLVLDTGVYSNTGGQSSKATPLGAIAKFAAAGKRTQRKDLALQAVSYGNVYVAQVAFGANPQQTLQAFREAEAYPGVSIILAYSHCISHGIDMKTGLSQQQKAVASGYWPLLRYDPALKDVGKAPFRLDSPRPTIKFKDYAYNELRYRALSVNRPEDAAMLLAEAQKQILDKYQTYEEFAQMDAGPDASRAMGAGGKF